MATLDFAPLFRSQRLGSHTADACHWAGVPRQADVKQKAASAREMFTTLVLCTPTSIMPGRAPGAIKSN
jgi:hypothetical protein